MVILVILLGMMLGSFISLLSFRLITRENIVISRSKCPNCKHLLYIKDLVPVFSWITSGGRCRYCQNKISKRYIIIEITASLLTVINFYLCYPHINKMMILIAITLCLLTMIITDFEHYILPDELQLAFLFLFVAFAYIFSVSLLNSLVTSIILGSIFLMLKYYFLYFRRKEALGSGDIKFSFIAGLFIPLEFIPLFLLLGGGLGVFTAIIWKKYTKSTIFPFGPSLIVAFMLVIYLHYIIGYVPLWYRN